MVSSVEHYYVELGRRVMMFASTEPGNSIEVPIAIQVYYYYSSSVLQITGCSVISYY